MNAVNPCTTALLNGLNCYERNVCTALDNIASRSANSDAAIRSGAYTPRNRGGGENCTTMTKECEGTKKKRRASPKYLKSSGNKNVS